MGAGSAGGAARAVALILDPQADLDRAERAGEAWAIGMLMGTAGMEGEAAQAALAEALAAGQGMSVAAFPAVAHATLARVRARGRRASGSGSPPAAVLGQRRGRL